MPGLLRGVARTAVIAGTATSVSNRVSRRQAGRWAQQDAEQAQARPAAAPPPTSVAPEDEMSNKIAQLKDLGDLKSQGVLSESEFEAQKARILNS
ncbi:MULTISPECIES: SHOCT domain-containing protein [Streptomyces]|uniref:SHOCT domain-containing protein n=1 Tax=Streptomyces TaxID=1883 RepID=UPI0021A95ECE|nr:SHOCT domain-containing protein [Streptomyces atratus]MCT2544472.1 SHOCT domain-containing protein [Streptomyces atratus]